MERIATIQSVVDALIVGNKTGAKNLLTAQWPFNATQQDVSKKRVIPPAMQYEVFSRDNFICRYCGVKTIFNGTLRLISKLLPNEFPYHPHWKWSNTHPAYWEISASSDHVVPFARGGKTDLSNLVTACYRCNSIKAQWLLAEMRWTLKESSKTSWDGLCSVFLKLMDMHRQINDRSLQAWYRLLTS